MNTIWYGDVSWLDFSKSAARAWYKDALKKFLGEFHIDAVWNDLNEPAQNYMPEAIYDYDGQPRTDAEARNLYALEEAKVSFDAQRELRPDQRPWIFSRSGSAGFHRYGANWGGDSDTSFDAYRANLEMSISMGLSGQPFFGHDIGGFLGSPSPELFLRWMTFSAYTPLFRNHAVETAERREPWVFGEPYLTLIRGIVEERYRLTPYFYSLFHRDRANGEPVLAPLPFHFPADDIAYVVDDDFLLGPSLLVAPIVKEGETTRFVYLPAGANWILERTDQQFAGGSWTPVTASIGQIPVFVRDGSIVPRAPLAQSTASWPLDRRRLDIYCGEPAAFELYEDDGVTFAFERGVFLTTSISCTPGQATTIDLRRTAGTWTPPANRSWTMVVHRVAARPTAVRSGGAALAFIENETALEAAAQGWTYDGGRVIAKVPDRAAPLTVTIER